MKDGNNKPIKTKRELALERMQTRYPDTNFEDDEVLYGKIVEDYDDYDKQLADYKERELEEWRGSHSGSGTSIWLGN